MLYPSYVGTPMHFELNWTLIIIFLNNSWHFSTDNVVKLNYGNIFHRFLLSSIRQFPEFAKNFFLFMSNHSEEIVWEELLYSQNSFSFINSIYFTVNNFCLLVRSPAFLENSLEINWIVCISSETGCVLGRLCYCILTPPKAQPLLMFYPTKWMVDSIPNPQNSILSRNLNV